MLVDAAIEHNYWLALGIGIALSINFLFLLKKIL